MSCCRSGGILRRTGGGVDEIKIGFVLSTNRIHGVIDRGMHERVRA